MERQAGGQTGKRQTNKRTGSLSEGHVETHSHDKKLSDKSVHEWMAAELSEECGNYGSTDGC